VPELERQSGYERGLKPACKFSERADSLCLQQQVDWISDCIAHLRQNGKTEIEATAAAQDAWVAHHDEIANATLVTKTDTWYMGSNVKGKPRRMLSYAGGVGTCRKLCDDVAAKGYAGFALA